MEIWKETEFSNYLISNKGNLKNLNSHGNCKQSPKKYYDKDGYIYYWIRINTKLGKCRKAHRLVALAFIENTDPTNKTTVNHKNGKITDNRVENLEWLSPADNERHARKVLGKRLLGEKASMSKLTEKQVRKIKRNKSPTSVLAKKYNVANATIYRIKKGICWGHLWETK